MWLIAERELLYHEPRLIKDCRSVAVRTFQGTGSLSNGVLTLVLPGDVGAPFVVEGSVVWVVSQDLAAYVVSDMGEGQVQLSLVHAHSDLDGGIELVVPPNLMNEAVEIYSFPQIRTAVELMVSELGLDVDKGPKAGVDKSLEHAAAMLALSMIFRTMSVTDRTVYGGSSGLSVFTTKEQYWNLAEYYERRYRQTLRRSRVLVDVNGDGVVGERVALGTTVTKRV